MSDIAIRAKHCILSGGHPPGVEGLSKLYPSTPLRAAPLWGRAGHIGRAQKRHDTPSKAAIVLALAAIVGVALGLRVWGIGFGLPYAYHYDEHFYINTALNLGAGVLNNPPYAPVGLSNILFPEYAVYFVLGRIQGIFMSPQQFEAAYRTDPTVFYLLARLTSAVLGALTVLPVYWLGRILRPKKPAVTGLLAASLVAVSFLYVRDAHYGVPDVSMSFAVTLAISIILAGVNRGRNRLVGWPACPTKPPAGMGGRNSARARRDRTTPGSQCPA